MKYILTRLQRAITETSYSEIVVWIPTIGTNKVSVEAGKHVYLKDDPVPLPWHIISVVGEPQPASYFEDKRSERKQRILTIT